MLNVLNFFFSKKKQLVFQHKIKITTSSDDLRLSTKKKIKMRQSLKTYQTRSKDQKRKEKKKRKVKNQNNRKKEINKNNKTVNYCQLIIIKNE